MENRGQWEQGEQDRENRGRVGIGDQEQGRVGIAAYSSKLNIAGEYLYGKFQECINRPTSYSYHIQFCTISGTSSVCFALTRDRKERVRLLGTHVQKNHMGLLPDG